MNVTCVTEALVKPAGDWRYGLRVDWAVKYTPEEYAAVNPCWQFTTTVGDCDFVAFDSADVAFNHVARWVGVCQRHCVPFSEAHIRTCCERFFVSLRPFTALVGVLYFDSPEQRASTAVALAILAEAVLEYHYEWLSTRPAVPGTPPDDRSLTTDDARLTRVTRKLTRATGGGKGSVAGASSCRT